MFGRLIRGISRTRSGIALLSGAAAVLAGVERALSTRAVMKQLPDNAPVTATPLRSQEDRFRIYRTQSELGYVYWVLQGRGRYQCFALFDTWDQAIQEADRRLAVAHRLSRTPAQVDRKVLVVR